MLITPSFAELIRTFALIGCLSFGGAAGQIAMMHRIIVEERRWLDESSYLAALNYCMLLPGPEAQQLATYIGWKTHGIRGGLAAGLLFVIPGAVLMLALSWLYVLGTGLTLVDGLFFGIKAAVLAIIVHALIKIAQRGLRTGLQKAIMIATFLVIYGLDIPFPLLVLAAGCIGAIWLAPATVERGPASARNLRSAGIAAVLCLCGWWAPVVLAGLIEGWSSLLVEVGLFFSKLSVVTFGGAYAVLAYLAQEGVARGWVTAQQMMDGLGLAETTPGPTILVNQFVAFLAGYSGTGSASLLVYASLVAVMATWVTFAPSFLWIFAGAPFLEDIRRQRRLVGALQGITASVVGVIGFVALWFALHALFQEVRVTSIVGLRTILPVLPSLDGQAAVLVLGAFWALFVRHLSIPVVTAGAAGAGAMMKLLAAA